MALSSSPQILSLPEPPSMKSSPSMTREIPFPQIADDYVVTVAAEDRVIPSETCGVGAIAPRTLRIAVNNVIAAAAIDPVVPTDDLAVARVCDVSAVGKELIAGDHVVAMSAFDAVVPTDDIPTGVTDVDVAVTAVCRELIAGDPVVAVSAVDGVVPADDGVVRAKCGELIAGDLVVAAAAGELVNATVDRSPARRRPRGPRRSDRCRSHHRRYRCPRRQRPNRRSRRR